MKLKLFGILTLLIQLSSQFPSDHAGRKFLPEQGNAFEGDIVLSPKQLEQMQASKSGFSQKYKFQTWQNKTIPYEFHKSLVLSDVSKARVKEAMNLIMDKISNCVKFVEHTDEDNYVIIQHDDELCQSEMGVRFDHGPQSIWIQPGCTMGNIAHELIHTLGFSHEQSRYDRNDYVRINFDNILADKKSNFDMDDAGVYDFWGVGYDYDSIMHYGSDFFGKAGADGKAMETITVLQAGAEIGQRDHLSKGDVQKIRNMYECK